MRGLKPKHLFWFLHISFLATFLLGTLVQPLYPQESELKKAKELDAQFTELFNQGRFAEALPIAEKVLSINEKMLGPEHPDVGVGYNFFILEETCLITRSK